MGLDYLVEEFLHAHGKTREDANGYAKPEACEVAEYLFEAILDPTHSRYRDGVLVTQDQQLTGIIKFFGNKTLLSTTDTSPRGTRIQEHGLYLIDRETYADAYHALRKEPHTGWAAIELKTDLFPVRPLDVLHPRWHSLRDKLRREYTRIEQETNYQT